MNRCKSKTNIPTTASVAHTHNQPIFKDGIVLIYSFLTFTELLTAGRIAHQWYQIIHDHISIAASGKRSPLCGYVYDLNLSTVERYQQFLAMLESPARVLINSIPHDDSKDTPGIVDLQPITNSLPQLTELSLNVVHIQRGPGSESLVASDRTLLTFSSNLLALTIHDSYCTGGGIKVVSPQSSFYQHLFTTICSQSSQLEKLIWRVPVVDLDVSGLLRLHRLYHLESSFTHVEGNTDSVLVQLPLKYWKQNYRADSNSTGFNWNVFHKDTLLMRNLEEWIIWDATFTPEDYRSLSLNAFALSRLELHAQLHRHFEGVRHLNDSQVQQLSLSFFKGPCNELSRLLQIRSLTLVAIHMKEKDWLELLTTQLCELEICWCNLPAHIVSYLPKRTTIRHMTIPQSWVKGLVDCQRLQELSLVDIFGSYSCEQLKNDLREICNSSANSLRWVEVRNWTETTPGTGQSIKSTFILDSSKSMTRPSHPFETGVESVGDAPPLKDLTRYGIEPHPGPTDITTSSKAAADEFTPLTTVSSLTSPSQFFKQLFKDGLFVIYSFLTLKEFTRATSVCHHWYQPISNQTTHPTNKCSTLLHYTYHPVFLSDATESAADALFLRKFLSLVHSPTRWFVTGLGRFAPTLVDFHTIIDRLPQLRNLSLDLSQLKPNDETILIRFPHQLLSCTINLWWSTLPGHSQPEHGFLQQIFDSICEQATQLEKLVWNVWNTTPKFDSQNYQRRPELNVSGLLKLHNLTDLQHRFSERDDTVGLPILAQLQLQRWKSIPSASAATRLNWTIFQPHTALMTHLEDWTLYDGALTTAEDYINLVQTAHGLTKLTLHLNPKSSASFKDGLMHLSQLKSLRHFQLEWCQECTEEVFTEMTYLTQLESLTFKSIKNLNYESWKDLFHKLTELESLVLDGCEFPIQILPHFPTSVIIRGSCMRKHARVPPQLTSLLAQCHRLREFTFIGFIMASEAAIDQFKNELKCICLSNNNSLRRIEVVKIWLGTMNSRRQSFIFDSPGPGFVQEQIEPESATSTRDHP